MRCDFCGGTSGAHAADCLIGVPAPATQEPPQAARMESVTIEAQIDLLTLDPGDVSARLEAGSPTEEGVEAEVETRVIEALPMAEQPAVEEPVVAEDPSPVLEAPIVVAPAPTILLTAEIVPGSAGRLKKAKHKKSKVSTAEPKKQQRRLFRRRRSEDS